MLASTDWTGISACIAAVFAGVVGVIGALAALRTNRQVQTGNGRTIGQAVVDAKKIAADTNVKVSGIANVPPAETVDTAPPAG